jgi:hypothetical protein
MKLEAGPVANLLVVQGKGKSAFILATVADKIEIFSHSQLSLVSTGAGFVVQTLDAGEAGLKISYPVHMEKRDREAGKEAFLRVGPVSTGGR